MDQTEAPMLDRLAAGRREHRTGFGAPGHHLGRGAADAVVRAAGSAAFAADLTTPKGLDDRTETHQTVQRAHALGARAWGGDMCRYTGGGSTQCLHMLLAACIPAGGRVLVARNAHKAEWSTAVIAGYDIIPLAVATDPTWDVEHTPTPDVVEAALAATPGICAVVIVSPTYFGAVADVAGCARAAHRHGVPLIVDAAWGAAFAFAAALPPNPLLEGADAMVVSVHKTLGSLGGGAALVQRGTLIDPDRLKMAYELLLTTSPPTPVLASIDGARREHVLHGDTIWNEALRLAGLLRAGLAAVPGVRVLGDEVVGRAGVHAFDATKVTIDVSGIGVSGYAADDWLVRERRVSMALSDGRHLGAVTGPGVSERDVSRVVRGVAALARFARGRPGVLASPPPPGTPPLSALSHEQAMPAADAFAARAEMVRWEEAAGRIAAETIAPAPPGIPRLVPGQRVSDAHVAWLTANRESGMFVLDPIDPAQRLVRVVA